MKIRNEVIRATYEFFNKDGFTKVDPPILTTKCTRRYKVNYSILNDFDQDAFYLKVVSYT